MTEQDIFYVPTWAVGYENEQVSELDYYRELQGQENSYGLDLARALYPVGEVDLPPGVHLAGPDAGVQFTKDARFKDFVIHRMKLERLWNKNVLEPKERERREANRLAYEQSHTCPVCKEVDGLNTFERPCKKCQTVIDYDQAMTDDRKASVARYLGKPTSVKTLFKR